MRRIPQHRLLRLRPRAPLSFMPCRDTIPLLIPIRRTLANTQNTDAFPSDLWFSSTPPCSRPTESEYGEDRPPPDERTLKLGKTIRTLHERLPSLLASPLPQEILSPQITLRLFPSTHPHLPTVSGRIAYMAALWTSPVAWGRVPVLGNVKLEILSERMIHNGSTATYSSNSPANNEKLIVRWKTCGKTKGMVSDQVSKITEVLGRDKQEDEDFYGLFIFEFDEMGRIIAHTIEHVQEGGHWERTAKVISVTDWLLSRAWGKKEDMIPGLALTDRVNRDGTR